MKPGDLVKIADMMGYYTYLPDKIGLIIGPKPSWSQTRYPVLVDEEILYLSESQLLPLEEPNETR